MPCPRAPGGSFTANANEGSTLQTTTLWRMANFFQTSGGGYSHLTHSSPLEQLCPPVAGAPKLGRQGALLPPIARDNLHPGSKIALRYTPTYRASRRQRSWLEMRLSRRANAALGWPVVERGHGTDPHSEST